MPTFPTPEPIAVTVDVTGDVRFNASDRTDTVVVVRPRDPNKAADVRAAESTVVELTDGRLVVRSPRQWRHYTPWGGNESIEVTIDLPTRSSVDGESSMGHLVADGELAGCRFKTGMGRIRLDHTGPLVAASGFGEVVVERVEGDAEITSGSGDIRIDEVTGGAVVKSANGRVAIGQVGGDLRIKASNGDVTVDHALASASAKTACGDVRILDVSRGTVVLETAAGEVEVGVRAGAAAWLDAHTRFGVVRSSLDDADGPGPSDSTVEVRARTSAGDILIGRSPATDVPPSNERSDA